MNRSLALVALCVECGQPVLPLSERCGPHHINWVTKQARAENRREYQQSDKYKESLRKYHQSAAFKEYQRKYQRSDKYKEHRRKYYLKKKMGEKE